MTARRVLTVLLGLGVVSGIIAVAVQRDLADGIITILFATLLVAHFQGWKWSGHALVVISIAFFLSLDPTPTESQVAYVVTILAPPVLAAVFLSWYWSTGAFLVCLLGAAIISQGQSVLFQTDVLITIIFITCGIALISAVTQTAQRVAEMNALRAEEALAATEEQARAMAQQATELQQQNEEQRRLLDLVTTLETPTVTLAPGVLFAPIVGHIDTRRAQAVTARLLEDANSQRARLVILDIGGVTLIDTSVAQALTQTTQALRLLGCDVAISGIRATVAITLTTLGLGLQGVTTVRSPQEALAQYVNATSPRRSDGQSSNG